VIVVDTGGLIAAVDQSSRLHQETKALLDEEQENPATRLLISPFVLAEVDYLL
jgi:predicted nucleic acid-binding protein